MTRVKKPVIVALDVNTQEQVMALVEPLRPQDCRLKVGKQLFTALGPSIVVQLQSLGFEVFLDLKFHDIPNTVAKAIEAACHLGVWMVNVHALGGERMLRAARQAVDCFEGPKPLLIGVTVLTSMAECDLQGVGLTGSALDNVERLAHTVQAAAFDGVVCSAQEAPRLRQRMGKDFLLVTPGIRFDWNCNDQKRVVTPQEALNNGSDYLVMGRSITQATSPAHTVAAVNALVGTE